MNQMNLPNKLTVIRLLMVPLCIIFIVLEKWMNADLAAFIAALLFSAASLTDMADGKIARKRNLVTDFGKFLDPVADKFLVIGCMMAVVLRYDNIRDWYFWVTLCVIAREFAVTSLRLVVSKSTGTVVAANWLGKVKTTVQIINILLVLMEPVLYRVLLPACAARDFLVKWIPLTAVSSALVVIFTLWSGFNYICCYGKFLKESM